MSRFAKALMSVFLLIILSAGQSKANTRAAASCNTSDVQAAINSAAEGDTVTIPAGSCAWASGVTISGKGISVQGAGSGRIIAISSSTLAFGAGSKTLSVTSTNVSGALSISNGQTLTLYETGNEQNHMTGTVTSYSSGALTLNVTSSAGGCGNSAFQSPSNCKRWLIATDSSTVLINNTSTAMFAVTEDATFHTSLSGFKAQAGSGGGNVIVLYAGGGAAVLVHDCWIQQGSGNSLQINVNRGVIWNCSFDSPSFSMAPIAFHIQPFDLTAWSTPSYFGMNDSNGQHNLYVENSDFHAYLNMADNDEGARSVFRYSFFNNAGFGTHGADTSLISQRYFEFYNNTGNFNAYNDGTTFNMNWWFFVRGGTFVIHDNNLPALQSTDYGTKGDLDMTVMNLRRSAGANPCWGAGTSGGAAFHAPQQVGTGYVTGTGHDGLGRSTYSLASFGYSSPQFVGDSEPGYVWGNSRQPLNNISITDYSGPANLCTGSNFDTSTNYIALNRDYFNGSTAKPGYMPYTYPHPLAKGSGTASNVAPPTNLTAGVQ
jgi:hypothetical protein